MKQAFVFDPERGILVPRTRRVEAPRLRVCSGRAHHGLLMGGAVAGDPNRSSLVLLIDHRTSDGLSSGGTTFTDWSPLGKTITRIGSAALDSNNAYTGNLSIYCVGSGGGFSASNSDGAYNFGSGAFFVEWRMLNLRNSSSNTAFVGAWSSGNNSWVMYQNATSTTLDVYSSSTGSSWDIFGGSNTTVPVTSMSSFSTFAFGRSGNSWGVWSNGVSNTTFTSSATLRSGATNLFMGCSDASGGASLSGYIASIRIYKGVCPRTIGANYTPDSGGWART